MAKPPRKGEKPKGRWITTDEGRHVFIGSKGEFLVHGPGSKPAKAAGGQEHVAGLIAKTRAAKGGTLPPRTADTMSSAISMSSPSGKVSKRAHAAASERLRTELFGKGGLKVTGPAQPAEAVSLRRQAAELRDLAGRGMKPRAYAKKAGELEAKAASLEARPATPTAPAPKAGGGFQLRGGTASAPAQSKLGLKPTPTQGRLFDTGKPAAGGTGTGTARLQITRDAAYAPKVGIKPVRQTPRETMADARARTAERLKSAKKVVDVQSHPEVHAQPGDVVNMKVGSVHFDPDRFQYKLSGSGEHGVSTQLHQVKNWNPESAGVISVWKDPANGKTYVINGHHRLDLANRLGVEKVTARFIDAPDAKTARMKGAITNIAEGRGSAIDAGKFFRDAGIGREAMDKYGIPMTESTARHGLNLAGLEGSIFKRVVNQEIPIERASIIGGSGLNDTHQLTVLNQATKMKANNATVRELVDNARSSPTITQRGRSLFGDTEDEVSLAGHRATVQSHVAQSLASDRKLFAAVSRSKAAQALEERGRSHIDVAETGKVSAESAQVMGVFHTLKNRSGPVAAELNRASERLHAGEGRDVVLREARSAITGHVKKLLEGGASAFD